jgi:nitrate reductase NapE component
LLSLNGQAELKVQVEQRVVTALLIAYMCGALMTAVGALAAVNRFSDHRAADPPIRALVAVLAGVLWPVVAVGLVQVLIVVGLFRWMRAAPALQRENVPERRELVPAARH